MSMERGQVPKVSGGAPAPKNLYTDPMCTSKGKTDGARTKSDPIDYMMERSKKTGQQK